MGTIATMKGSHGNMYSYGASNGSNIRRKWNIYLLTLIILLVFGAAVLGLMGIHRLRDRRIFNLLIKDKDSQILSLQHFLQKERKHVQDDKMTIEGMKSKIYSLRAHNKELNQQVSEMESTIASLKDEQKIIESALDEKQNEVISLRQSFEEMKDQNPQIQSLEEILKQKEAELQDLQNHIQLPTNVDSKSITNQSQFEKVEKDGNNTHYNGDVENKRGFREAYIIRNAANEKKVVSISDGNVDEDMRLHRGGVKIETVDGSDKETGVQEMEKINGENETTILTDQRLFDRRMENISRLEEVKPENQTRVEDIRLNVVIANMTAEILKKSEQDENASLVKSQVSLNGVPEHNANNETSGSYFKHITQNENESVKNKNSGKSNDSYEDEAQT